MAIKVNVEKFGTTVEKYVRIELYQGQKEKIVFNVGEYLIDGDDKIKSKDYGFEMNIDLENTGDNILSQGYIALKTRYPDCVDC